VKTVYRILDSSFVARCPVASCQRWTAILSARKESNPSKRDFLRYPGRYDKDDPFIDGSRETKQIRPRTGAGLG